MAITTITEQATGFLGGSGTVTECDISSGQTGPAIWLASSQALASCNLIPSSGSSGKLQYTTSRPSLVNSGTANWADWAAGTITAPASSCSATPGPLVAVRGVCINGTIVVEVVQWSFAKAP